MKLETKTIRVPIEQLVPAAWNYKSEGTPEQIEKLKKSIARDKSAGVPAVREVSGKYEVIDGNHRLTALREMGVSEVVVEDFGKLSKADAILVARRRNHAWFTDDMLKLGELLKTEVLTNYSPGELAEFMPDTEREIAELAALSSYNWKGKEGSGNGSPREGYEILRLELPESLMRLWLEWKQRVAQEAGDPDVSDVKVLEYALAEALALPLRQKVIA